MWSTLPQRDIGVFSRNASIAGWVYLLHHQNNANTPGTKYIKKNGCSKKESISNLTPNIFAIITPTTATGNRSAMIAAALLLRPMAISCSAEMRPICKVFIWGDLS